jgi:drug/metabolite transporter (DMT)-like permease
MQNDKLRNYFHLHFIVFIWGFTAILGKLITLDAMRLVWFRMFFATLFLALFLVIKKQKITISKKTFVGFFISGIIIALHWLTFFLAIKVSNISITLACLSTGALFTSFLEPLFYKKKIVIYEVFFGLLAVIGLALIFNVDAKYTYGIIIAITSAFLSALFSVINSKYAKEYDAGIISFYELASGVFFISLWFLFRGEMTLDFFVLTLPDLGWLLLLASVCTAYAFMASVKVMKVLTAFTVMLTINLEPVYGIILALLIFKDEEEMGGMFYLGASILLSTVIINGVLKNSKKRKLI